MDPESSFFSAAENLRKELKIPPVNLLVSEKISDAIATGDFSGNTVIVFSKSLIETLDLDEFDTILLHEFFHLQADVRDSFASNVFERTILGRLGWMRIFLAVSIFTAFFVPLPIVGSSTYATKSGIMIWLTTIIYMLGLGVAIGIAVILLVSLKEVTAAQRLVSPESFYIRELEADAYSLLESKKPEKLRSALLKSEITRSGLSMSNKPLVDLSIVDKIVQSSKGAKTFPEIFQIKSVGLKEIGRVAFYFFVYGRLDKHDFCPLSDRIFLTKKLELLLKEKIVLRVQTNVSSSDIKLDLVLPGAGIYIKKHPEALDNFLIYANLHSTDFSLKECSEELKLDIYDVFLLLLTSIELGFVEIQL